jgi:hypothetical protein
MCEVESCKAFTCYCVQYLWGSYSVLMRLWGEWPWNHGLIPKGQDFSVHTNVQHVFEAPSLLQWVLGPLSPAVKMTSLVLLPSWGHQTVVSALSRVIHDLDSDIACGGVVSKSLIVYGKTNFVLKYLINLTVPQLVKMLPTGSLWSLQQPVTCPYPEPC